MVADTEFLRGTVARLGRTRVVCPGCRQTEDLAAWRTEEGAGGVLTLTCPHCEHQLRG